MDNINIDISTPDVFRSSLLETLTSKTIVVSSKVKNESINVELKQISDIITVSIDNNTNTMPLGEFSSEFIDILYTDIKNDYVTLTTK
jgi:hypothetical protein